MKPYQAFLTIIINVLITLIILFVVGVIGGNDQIVNRQSVHQSYQLSSTEQDLVNLVTETNPAVLSIIVSQDVPVYQDFLSRLGPFGFVVPDRREVGIEERQIGSGSGFVVSDDGLIVTNRHVVNIDDADYVGIDSEGNQYDLELVARDSMLDIAVMKIIDPPSKLTVLEFGDSNELRLGQSVVAIGNALGEFSNTVSTGIVSGLSRSIMAGSGYGDSELLENVIQTDAAINPGNSGGPLLNLAGQVIGVNVAVARGSENVAFSIPSNAVVSIVDSVEREGRIVRPYLGVRYVMVNEVVSAEFGLKVEEGALVVGSGDGFAVDPTSPAAAAGIREGDVILSINQIKVNQNQSLGSILRMLSVGDEVDVVLNRQGNIVQTTATLVEFE